MHSYLKLLQPKIQDLSELVSSTLNMDITVVDSNFRRIAGTGDFFEQIDTQSPKISIFGEVLKTGLPAVNNDKHQNKICRKCPSFPTCFEKKNITLPILIREIPIGVVSLACFTEDQLQSIYGRESECQSMLRHMKKVIENEIVGLELHNKIISHKAELNEVINCIDKGIIVIGEDFAINHINSAAITNLDLNMSKETIINSKLNKIISGIKLGIHENVESLAYWNLKNKQYKVIYKINRIILESKNHFTIITFDTIKEMINKVIDYKDKNVITFSSIIGKSDTFKSAIKAAQIAANSDSNVLLSGESGTGKELFARSIHNESYRRNGPFIAVNCASIPESLIESELFGYEKGSFTGADPLGRKGKFEAAEGGTLFLDEITEIPINWQAKLLRVLQEKTVSRIGSIKPVNLNVRIIAASNSNLQEKVINKEFRLDLFFRLHIIPVYLPALREREDDVLILADYLLENITKKLHKRSKQLSQEVKNVFTKYHWPGNIRELENLIEYGINFCFSDEIQIQHLPDYITNRDIQLPCQHFVEKKQDIKSVITEIEKKVIKQYLDEYGNSTESKKKIAKELNISLTTLYRKLGKL